MSDWKETETMRQAREQRVPRARYDEVCRERNTLKAQLDAANAACAEMRESLLEHALSTDCGKGYVPVSELTPAIELLLRIKIFLQDYLGSVTHPGVCRMVSDLRDELDHLKALKEGKQ